MDTHYFDTHDTLLPGTILNRVHFVYKGILQSSTFDFNSVLFFRVFSFQFGICLDLSLVLLSSCLSFRLVSQVGVICFR